MKREIELRKEIEFLSLQDLHEKKDEKDEEVEIKGYIEGMNPAFRLVLIFMLTCFHYLLKTQVIALLGVGKTRGYEIINEWDKKGLIAVGDHRKIDYVCPAYKLVAWFKGDWENAKGVTKEPGEDILLDHFIRAAYFILKRDNRPITLDKTPMDGFLVKTDQNIKELDALQKELAQLEEEEPKWYRDHYDNAIRMAERQFVTDSMLNVPLPTGKLERLNPTLWNGVVEQFKESLLKIKDDCNKTYPQLVDNIKYGAGNYGAYKYDLAKWELAVGQKKKKIEKLKLEIKVPIPPSTPINKDRVNQLKKLNVNRKAANGNQGKGAFEHIQANTDTIEGQMEFLQEAFRTMRKRHCYYGGAFNFKEKEVHITYAVVGFAESSDERYLNILRLFDGIMDCFNADLFLTLDVLCENEEEKAVIETRFNHGLDRFYKQCSPQIKKQNLTINFFDVGLKWKYGHDVKKYYKLPDQSVIDKKVSKALEPISIK